ncbi:hypothetical protein GCM10011514_07380 [Emticicia aquatilis]|uniref:DUF6443 domain-containing protein n=2 Tax=Emticicia aquatilis TaxID=1537369 RepID=A0A916YIA2_9BACT|nr:hypothetical protein GCM10011514_07380 [Emticicia aquatilis]
MWRDEDCNDFSLKVVFPKGFQQISGNYTDFIDVHLSEEKPYQDFKIRGVFFRPDSIATFMVLKGPIGSDANTIFVKKKEFEIFVDGNISNSESLVVSKSEHSVMDNCGVNPPEISVYPKFFLNGQNVTLSAYQCNGTVVWSDGTEGAYISTYPTQTTTYTATCTENGCTSNASLPQTITLTTDCNLATIGSPYVDSGNAITSFITSPNDLITLSSSGFSCTEGQLVWSTGDTSPTINVQPTISTTYKLYCKFGTCLSKDFIEYKVFVKCNSVTPPILQIINEGGPNIPVYTIVGNNCSGTINWFRKDGLDNYFWLNTIYYGFVEGNNTLRNVTYGEYRAICVEGDCSSDFSQSFIVDAVNAPPPPLSSNCPLFSITSLPSPSSETPLRCGENLLLNISGCKEGSLKEILIRTYGLQNDKTTYISSYSNTVVVPSLSNLSPPNPSFSDYYYIATRIGCENTCNTITRYSYNWIRVNPFDNLKLTVNTPSVQCAGGATTLKANENCGGTFEWSNGMVGQSISVSPTVTTSYQVKCVSPNCNNPWSDPVTITVDPNVSAPSSPTIVSDNQYYSIGGLHPVRLDATGCTDGTIYWSDGDVGFTTRWVRPSVTTTYTAKCSKNGCLSQPSNAILIQVCGISNPPVLTSNKTQTDFCNDRSVLFTISGCSSGGLYIQQYHLNGNLKQGAFTSSNTEFYDYPTNSTIYKVRCINDGCESALSNPITVTVEGTPDTPAFTEPQTICSGQNAVITITNCSNGLLEWYSSDQGLDTPVQVGGNTYTTPIINLPNGIEVQYKYYYAKCTVNDCNTGINGTILTIANPLPPAITIDQATLCVNNGGGTVLRATGCIDGQIIWSNASIGNIIAVNTPAATTTYTAVCKIGNCQSPTSNIATLTILPLPTIPTLSASKINVCPGGSTAITASGCTGNVSWSNGAIGISQTVTLTTETSYSAKCVNSCGESAFSLPITISVAPLSPPVISANISTICYSDINPPSATLTATGCVGTVEWSTNQIGNSINVYPSTSTNYTAVCKLEGCISTTSNVQQVTVITVPLAPSLTSDKNNICVGSGDNVTLTAAGCNGTLKWYINGTLVAGSTAVRTFTPTATTNYQTTCSNQCGESVKSVAKTITLTPIPARPTLASQKANVCVGESTILNATGCTGIISWSGGGILASGPSVSVAPTSPTTYSAQCTVDGCTSVNSIATITIGILTNTNPSMVSILSDVCPGTPVELFVYGCTGTISWKNLVTNAVTTTTTNSTTFVINSSTSYEASCQGTCSTVTTNALGINTFVQPTPPVVSAINNLTTICEGTTTTLQATNCVGDVIWSTGFTGNQLLVSSAGNYSAKCVSFEGCLSIFSNIVSITTKAPITNLTATSDGPKKVGETINFSSTVTPVGTYTYSWAGPNNFVSAVASPTILNAQLNMGGVYTVTVNDGVCLPSTATVDVSISDPFCNCTVCDQPTNITNNPTANPNISYKNYHNVVENYYLKPTTTIPTGNFEISQTISYLDGLGRPLQAISNGTSPLGKDMVQPYQYDALGRITKTFLPYATTQTANNGAYRPNALTPANYATSEQSTFYSSLKTDGVAYAEVKLEESPIQKLLQQGNVGSSWQIGDQATAKTVKADYRHNTATDGNIKKVTFDYANATNPWKVANYAVNELMIVETKDELNRRVETFTDVLGQTVCKKVYNGAEVLITYTAFDDFGRVRLIFPPRAADNLASVATNINPKTNASYKDLIYWYEYDARGRIITKKVASTASTNDATSISIQGEEEYVYNNIDQVVLYRNGMHKPKRQWLYTKYDELGRVVSTGLFTISSASNAVYNNRTKLQTLVNTTFVTAKYGNAAFPTSAGFNATGAISTNVVDGSTTVGTTLAYTYNYYDGYTNSVFTGKTTTLAVTQLTLAAQKTNVIGKLTGTQEAVLLPTGSAAVNNNVPLTIYYYDKFGRAIQTRATNHTNTATEDIASSQFDFVGRVEKTFTETKFRTGTSTQITTTQVLVSQTYDLGSRVKTVCQQINGGKKEPVGRYAYNEIGELREKTLGCDIQKVVFDTDIHGWLKSINDPATLFNEKKFFGMKLDYDFDGTIKSQEWGTLPQLDATAAQTPPVRKYTYTYDGINRLKTAIYTGGFAGEKYDIDNLNYDKNGNITSLRRTINGVVQDNLSYLYATNNDLLASVNEGTGGLSDATKPWFRNGFTGTATIGTGSDYTYDWAGNLTKDANKKITAISYNALNLVESMTFVVSGVTTNVRYTYTGSGSKIRKENHDTKKIEYVAGLVYTNAVIEFVPTPEGRALLPVAGSSNTDWRYEYQITDHLGNLRMAFRCGDPKRDANNNIIGLLGPIVTQENHYDPWGINLQGIEKTGTPDDWFQFNGGAEKSLSPEGIAEYETDFRLFDPQIGRFKAVDPLAAMTSSINPFQFGFNNPVMFNDPSGLFPYASSSSGGGGGLTGIIVGLIANKIEGLGEVLNTINAFSAGSEMLKSVGDEWKRTESNQDLPPHTQPLTYDLLQKIAKEKGITTAEGIGNFWDKIVKEAYKDLGKQKEFQSKIRQAKVRPDVVLSKEGVNLETGEVKSFVDNIFIEAKAPAKGYIDGDCCYNNPKQLEAMFEVLSRNNAAGYGVAHFVLVTPYDTDIDPFNIVNEIFGQTPTQLRDLAGQYGVNLHQQFPVLINGTIVQLSPLPMPRATFFGKTSQMFRNLRKGNRPSNPYIDFTNLRDVNILKL